MTIASALGDAPTPYIECAAGIIGLSEVPLGKRDTPQRPVMRATYLDRSDAHRMRLRRMFNPPCPYGVDAAWPEGRGLSLPSTTLNRSALVIDGHQYFSICSMASSVPRLWLT